MFIGKNQIRLHNHGICLDFKVFHACSQALPLKRASRSLAKTGFFLVVFRWFLHVFLIPNAPKTILCWTSSWDASWRPLGAILGGFLEAKMRPRWPKMAPRPRKMAPRRRKMAPRSLKMTPRRANMALRQARMAPRRAKIAQDGAKTCQDGAKTCQDGAKTGLDGAKMGNMAERAQLASERSERCERSAADDASFQGLL